ncbi:hypothetical protein MMA231_02876 [Asticcacaulis sp. MM231]|uniref:hypothetical protein n=1 Tax=Asticcacaulis sp. MM231 TaxID=3157666 RepID=UPI0032D5869C
MSKPKSSGAALRVMAAGIFAAIPAIALPVYIDHFYRVRPTVTRIAEGFIQPHFRDGVGSYFTRGDEMVIRGLSFWLMAAIILFMFMAGHMMRRRLKIMLRPPRDPQPVVTEDAGTTPANPA